VICSVLIVTTLTSLRASRKQAEAEAAQAESEGAPKDSIEA
jgi:tellurite resistance protein TerC